MNGNVGKCQYYNKYQPVGNSWNAKAYLKQAQTRLLLKHMPNVESWYRRLDSSTNVNYLL
ncbi:MAG TPA: hypothetical protein VF233_01635 [Nitrososphaeraceae archaeon]